MKNKDGSNFIGSAKTHIYKLKFSAILKRKIWQCRRICVHSSRVLDILPVMLLLHFIRQVKSLILYIQVHIPFKCKETLKDKFNCLKA